jgi:phosphate acetyltransferase
MNTNTRENFQRLIAAVKVLPAIPTAVAHPCDESSLAGALDAAKLGIIAPILVGPREWILAAASATSPYSGSPRRAISVSTIT